DYTGFGDPNSATWEEQTVTGRSTGNSWDFVDVDTVDLSTYDGESTVYIAFKYTSSTSNAGTWEIGEIVVSTAGADTTPPTLVSANATSSTTVRVTFSEKVSQQSAEDIANYSIEGLDISAADLQPDEKNVVLTTSEQTPGEIYTLTVSNVEDLAGNSIEPNSTIDFTGYSPGGGGENVFFSEYIEGSSQNKALEIYNGADSEISLSNYRIAQSTNGNGWQYWHYFPEGASIAAGDVWVITTDQANSTLQAVADEILSYPSVVHFNGNDARGLGKTTDGGQTWTLIDVIGVATEDPITGWDVAGVSEATQDHTLVRKAEITQGNTDWLSSAGTNADDSEWIVYEIDTFDYLGSHEAGADTTPPTLVSANATSSTTVRVTFSEKVSQQSAEDIANYSIEGLDISAADLQPDEKNVVLTTSEQTPGEIYTLTVSNVEDLAGNQIEPNSTIDFTGYSPGEYDLIADIQARPEAYEGQEVTVCGVVTIGVNVIQTGLTKAYVQDNSGRGINIYDSNVIEELERGNLVEITGTVTEYVDSYGDPTTEITNPVVTVLATGQPEPTPLIITFSHVNSLALEGTLVQITGEIEEIYYAGGGTNINLTDGSGTTFTVRVWDTTGLELGEFSVGDIIKACGIASVYQGKLQILPGYQDHLQLSGLITDYFDIVPAQPEPGDSVTVIFTCPEDYIGACDSVVFYWRTEQHLPFQALEMEPWEEKVSEQYFVTLPGQPAGTTVYFYVAITDTTTEEVTTYPEGAPAKLESFSITPVNLTASLKVPPRTFCPSLGEKIEIQVHARKELDKVILRLYNSEGNLVHTFFNKVSKGSETIVWNGKDESWNTLPPGLYICHLEVIDRQSGSKKTDIAPIVISAPLKN
ncbi:MAG: lamin tail domain-containing protein, partial [Candidatus Cloacimonadia bacterium]